MILFQVLSAGHVFLDPSDKRLIMIQQHVAKVNQ